ncbi:hypothetical protein [Oceanimonas baumannii]|uniref:Uncharacterized protein n=1 Tax=Oceanimonas baumannii TaxID=129578 RepID=A0ABY2EVF0_9GAMM|nr:hypothetical protein [Oceanimonas baumannii]TDW56279.1 hypothetical protein LY04_03082 [Oceanimonas baumannii]
MSFRLMPSFSKSACTRVALGMFLLGATFTLMAEEKSGYDLLLEMTPKPHEIELARKGVAEANIDKPWERACPYRELTGTAEAEDEYFFRCQRWDDCVSAGASASIYSEAFFQNHQRQPEDQMSWESYRDGSIFLLEPSDFERVTGHLRQYALKSAEENWRLFEGRDAAEASDLVEKKFWQWCSAEPLTLWEAEYQ